MKVSGSVDSGDARSAAAVKPHGLAVEIDGLIVHSRPNLNLIAVAGIRKNYFLYGRVDTIVNHPELFAKWAGIGLAQVFVGMEDFSDKRLTAMQKGITTAQQAEAAVLALCTEQADASPATDSIPTIAARK